MNLTNLLLVFNISIRLRIRLMEKKMTPVSEKALPHLGQMFRSNPNAWGVSTSVDLHGCNHRLITDVSKIRQFIKELCKRIDMKTWGDCHVVKFGEDPRVAGYSAMQLIETSLISAHLADDSDRAFWDVFSCKEYDPNEVAKFAQEFFESKDAKTHTLIRE